LEELAPFDLLVARLCSQLYEPSTPLLSSDTIRFIAELERVTSAPVSLIATRFAFRSIIDRRNWS
jgi:hypothetical protein